MQEIAAGMDGREMQQPHISGGFSRNYQNSARGSALDVSALQIVLWRDAPWRRRNSWSYSIDAVAKTQQRRCYRVLRQCE